VTEQGAGQSYLVSISRQRLDQRIFQDPFQSGPFYGSTILLFEDLTQNLKMFSDIMYLNYTVQIMLQ